MIKLIKKITPLLILVIIAASCSSRKGFEARDISYIYNTHNLAPRPEFVVYNISDSVTRIYYRLRSSELLYMKDRDDDLYRASFLIDYSLVPSFENTVVLDSGRLALSDQSEKVNGKIISGYFDLKTAQKSDNNNYVLQLSMIDQNRQVKFENYLRIDKSPKNISESFLMTDTAGNVIYKNHIATNTPFLLDYSGKPPAYYWVSYYHRDFPLALPPYSSENEQTFDLTPDTTYRVPANAVMTLPKSGFYHFRLDTSTWEGFTVYSFYDQFPYIAKRVQMGPPLRYLTTRKEYNDLLDVMNQPANLKKKVDEFWLNRAGSVERSKILVEAYYNRVQEANIFFSSYLEGWKTDRGIIYIVYGPPDKVYRSSDGEAWVYGDETSALSYYFSFSKVNNPFTDNDYSLQRMNSYRYGWGQAIEAWRNGHIYNSKDIKREQDEQEQNRYRQGPPYWN